MQKQELTIQFKVHLSPDTLSESSQVLWNHAIVAKSTAYAPYSDFQVGAAVLLDNGQIVSGSNQENAAFPSGLCAERVALFYAKSQYPDSKVLALAVHVSSNTYDTSGILSPCGACRQVMAEVRSRQEEPLKIFFPGENEQIIELSDIDGLVPFMFSLKK